MEEKCSVYLVDMQKFKDDNNFTKEPNGESPEKEIHVEQNKSKQTAPEVGVREQWGRQVEFILSCVGYSVGLGNLLRFPYLCMRNGGGAFLIPYFLFLFLCGLPLFYLELILGQYSGLSALHVWKLAPLFKGIGWGMLITSTILSIYYNLLITYVLYYLGMSFTSTLPWTGCDHSWNTPYCYEPGSNRTDISDVNSSTLLTSLLQENSSEKWRTASEEFWEFNVLEISSGLEELGGIRWQLVLCLLAAWIIVFLCMCKGILSSGKIVYVTATFPYLVLTMLLVRGALLPGAVEGIKFYITPDFNQLLKLRTWAEACLQVFFSLGPAWGGLTTMASYNKFNNNCLKDSIIICLTCSGTSLYSGFVIFSVIGFMAQDVGLPVSEVITSGPGLAFVVYPQAISKLPISQLWAVFFFLMLLTLGLDSQFCTVETVLSGFVDRYPRYLRPHKTLFTIVVIMAMFAIGIVLTTRGGIYIYQLLDWYVAACSILLIGLMEPLILSYVYGFERLYKGIEDMLGRRPSILWKLLWGGVTPLLLAFIFVYNFYALTPPQYGDYLYPDWARGVGWAIALVSVLPIPGGMVVGVMKEEGSLKQRVLKLLKPEADWGPAVVVSVCEDTSTVDDGIKEYPFRDDSQL